MKMCFSDFQPTVSNQLPSAKKNNKALIAGLVVGLAALCALSAFAIFLWKPNKFRQSKRDDEGKD